MKSSIQEVSIGGSLIENHQTASSSNTFKLPMHPALAIVKIEDEETTVYDIIQQQSDYLHQIFLQTQNLMSEVNMMSEFLKTINQKSQIQDIKEEDVKELSVIKEIRNLYENPKSPFSVKLSHPIGQTFYKNKPFQLKLKISKKVQENVGRVILTVKVFAYEYPIKEIVHSSRGESILINGKAKEADVEEIIKFKKICFTEVSKRYPNEKFILVVFAVGRNDISPLIIDGIQVKSRSPKS